jgi:glycerol-3-phosphate acyltransferase PlsX
MRIALDAMGGDFAPGPIVEGAIQALRTMHDLTVVLVGDQARIEAELARFEDLPQDRLPIVHTSQVIEMDEKPVEALRRKRDNSIARCWMLLAAGDVKAVVSAGNTGAMVGAGLFSAKMFLPGVRRPGIAAIYPTHQGPAVVIDVGANMHPKPEDLYQYGIMGAIYAEHVLNVSNPSIGLLNVGAEEDKGNELVRAAQVMFKASRFASRFVGNIEGRDIYEGKARVIVCEGFTGNVVLKAGEGAVEFLFAELKQEVAKLLPRLSTADAQAVSAGFRELKARFEYAEFGGAPLLGIKGACIICHGSSDQRAIKNAIRVAAIMAEDRISSEIVSALADSPDAPSVERPGAHQETR